MKMRLPSWFKAVTRTVDKSYRSFAEAADEPAGVVSIFFNDGDLALGITRDGFMSYFRYKMIARRGKGKGKPVSAKDFKAVIPVNPSLAKLVDPNHIQFFVNMAYTLSPDSPRYDEAETTRIAENTKNEPNRDLIDSAKGLALLSALQTA